MKQHCMQNVITKPHRCYQLSDNFNIRQSAHSKQK